MDRIDAPGAASEGLSPRGSQSRLSAAIFFVLLAALLFRVVTAVARPRRRQGRRPRFGAPAARALDADREGVGGGGRTGKPVLYDFTAAWCVPCHRLDDEGWGDREIAGLANDGYVPARVVDREREDGRNPPLVGGAAAPLRRRRPSRRSSWPRPTAGRSRVSRGGAGATASASSSRNRSAKKSGLRASGGRTSLDAPCGAPARRRRSHLGEETARQARRVARAISSGGPSATIAPALLLRPPARGPRSSRTRPGTPGGARSRRPSGRARSGAGRSRAAARRPRACRPVVGSSKRKRVPRAPRAGARGTRRASGAAPRRPRASPSAGRAAGSRGPSSTSGCRRRRIFSSSAKKADRVLDGHLEQRRRCSCPR